MNRSSKVQIYDLTELVIRFFENRFWKNQCGNNPGPFQQVSTELSLSFPPICCILFILLGNRFTIPPLVMKLTI